jgi:hypothetical protein
MPALRAVTEAKKLLDQAQGWWALTWASEENKRKIRSAIERATAALDREIASAKNSWSENMQSAYRGKKVAPAISRTAKALKQAEAEFNRATAQAKKTFDEAEKEWNAAKARDGALAAKQAIEKHETVLEMAKDAGTS